MSKRSAEPKNPLFLHLDLANFKTERCTNSAAHDAKKCAYFHFPSEKRRSQRAIFYVKSLCPNKDACGNEACPAAHNFVEQIYHSDSYKKKYCKDFIEKRACKYEEFCAMAHSDLELKITPLHLLPVDKNFLLFSFKSEFCPFSKISHDRFKCVYAHNWQDFKRPFSEAIKPVPCKAWDRNKEIMEYDQGCERAFDCPHCHGWKELEYHLANFKRHPCQKGRNCDRKEVCSFTHPDEETEPVRQEEFFHPVAKNIDYGVMRTADYLQVIEVPVFWTSSQSNYNAADANSLIFKSKALGNHLAPPDEGEIDDEDGFGYRPVPADPSKQRFSEKAIVRNTVSPRLGPDGKNYFSEKAINRSARLRGDDGADPPQRSPGVQPSFEKNRPKAIQENNEENSSGFGDNDM